MSTDLVKPLVQQTLREPQAAAARIIGLGLGRETLWTGLALVAALNTFVVLLALQISPPTMAMPSYFDQPLVLFFLLAGMMVVYIHAMFWTGRVLGGAGDLGDVLALVVWFQFLRAAAQLGVIALSLALPVLGLFATLVVAIWGLWIFLNFVSAALRLPTVWHALAVLVLSAVGLIVGLGLLMALIGLLTQGVA